MLVGEADPPEGLLTVQIAFSRQVAGDLVGLVEPAPAPPSPVEGDGDERPGRIDLRVYPWIVPHLLGEKGEFAVKVQLPAILVGMHQFTRLAVGACGCPGELEGELVPTAL